MPNAILPIYNTPPFHRLVKQTRHLWLRIFHSSKTKPIITTTLLIFTVMLMYYTSRPTHTFFTLQAPFTSHINPDEDLLTNKSISLFIAIGSAPQNSHLRSAAREGWLQWLPSDGLVTYRFFTDAPPNTITSSDKPMWDALAKESATHQDLVQQPLPSGYGDKEHNAYALRARYQVKWALKNAAKFTFFLRVDDDSFICLHKLLYELKAVPRRQFFWGRFWCREGRNRADENFMLFSRDVVALLGDDSLVGRLLPFDNEVTLGWNFGYWSWVLNLTIFDDQKRLDAQQGELTDYMHGEVVAGMDVLGAFCETFLYAHHVRQGTMRAAYRATRTHLMYPLPERTEPAEGCGRLAQSFVPARHSRRLPDLRLTRLVNGLA